MDVKIEKLSEWARADCAFDDVAARKTLAAHDAGRYDEAAGFLMDAFRWSAAPWPANCVPAAWWGGVCERLRSAHPKPQFLAMNVIRKWLGEPVVSVYSTAVNLSALLRDAPPIAPTLTEDQVATWLAARGMTMIDTKELAALKRNGTSGPAPMDGETYRRVTRF